MEENKYYLNESGLIELLGELSTAIKTHTTIDYQDGLEYTTEDGKVLKVKIDPDSAKVLINNRPFDILSVSESGIKVENIQEAIDFAFSKTTKTTIVEVAPDEVIPEEGAPKVVVVKNIAEQGHDNYTIYGQDLASDKVLKAEIERATQKDQDLKEDIDDLQTQINNEVSRATNKENELNTYITNVDTNLKQEIIDARAAERKLDQKIDSVNSTLTDRIDTTDTELSEFETYTKEELAKKIESVELIKNNDLTYTILVDSTEIGTINIPKDQFLESVELIETTLRFVFITTTGKTTTDIKLTDVFKAALEGLTGDVASIKELLDETVKKLDDEITRAIHKEELLEHAIEDVQNQVTNNSNTITQIQETITNIRLKDVEQDFNIENLEKTINSDLNAFKQEVAESLNKKIESVELQQLDSNNYLILVDGQSIGVINIPKDSDFSQNLNDLTNALNNEIVRAKSEESSLKTQIDTNDKVITERADRIESNLNTFKTDTNAALDKKINSVEVQQVDPFNYLVLVDGSTIGTITIPKDKYLQDVQLIGSVLRFTFNDGDEVRVQDINLQDILTELIANVTSLQEAMSQLTIKLNEEINRAKSEESRIESKLDSEINRATQQESFISDKLQTHINDTNNPHRVTAEQLGVYTKDQIDSTLKDMSDSNSSDLKEIKDKLSSVAQDVNNHINNTSNPHQVTKEQVGLGKVDNTSDLEKPISVAVQDAINQIYLYIQDNYPKLADFNAHIYDYNNPHRVNKEQVGLGNVDNTADMDKPISTATQNALDKKADVIHTHTMSDITDLEQIPVIAKGFVTLLTELPEDPNRGDKYVLRTYSGTNSYTYELLEWDADAQGWKQKVITTGGITCIIDGNVWKLNSTGPERILDASDYKYFYNKLYDETKDLIEDIDWEENDAENETNGQIRLKITYKTKYGDPDPESQIESEVTNPYQAKAVKYIDIDKARFLSNAYSRPATQEDLDKGYAKTLGEPMLILVFTTGDYVAIRLNELVDIYDEVDTDSIDLTVTDWTGDKETSYKISADLNIANTKGQENSISLHINSTNGDKGLYGTLHTQTTNSITLNPSTGTSGQKYLTADLKIDNALNNVNDVLLSISSSGLSARIIVGEYD